ncbi:MAG: sugar phosphate isomerase/epimerase family protein [Lachnospiraceae bacterium]
MKISLMTMTMFMRMYFSFKCDQEMEALKENYEEMMELVANAGYEMVDVTNIETQIFSIPYIGEVLKKNGLRVSSYIYMDQFANEQRRIEQIENAKQGVRDAVALGTKVLMLVPLAHEGIEKLSSKEVHAELVKQWSPIADYAKKFGMHTVIEDTPDLKLYLCSADELKEILQAVPNLEVVYDSANMLLVDEDPIAYYDTFADKTAHIHVKDIVFSPPTAPVGDIRADGRRMTGVFLGHGLVDLKTVLEHVVENKYDGCLSVEFVADEALGYEQSLIRNKEYIEKMIALS